MGDYYFNESGFLSWRFAIKDKTNKHEYTKLYDFVYISSGRCTVKISNKTLVANSGQLVFIPTDNTADYTYEGENGESCYGCVLRVRFFAGVEPWTYDAQVATLSDEVIKAINDLPFNEPIKDCNYLRRTFTFLDLVQNCMEKANDKWAKITEKAHEFMYQNNDFSITDVAKYCNVSECYLFKIIQKNVGMSPVKLKQKIQAEKAERLVRDTNLTVDEIANRVGFSCTAHFRKVFDSRFHMTPSEMRKKHQNNIN